MCEAEKDEDGHALNLKGKISSVMCAVAGLTRNEAIKAISQRCPVLLSTAQNLQSAVWAALRNWSDAPAPAGRDSSLSTFSKSSRDV